MKLSNGLKNMFAPLMAIIQSNTDLVCSVGDIIEKELRKVGKRGNGTYYPTDLKRTSMVLESIHDVTGLVMEAMVINGDFNSAIRDLQFQVANEDYIISLDGLTLHS